MVAFWKFLTCITCAPTPPPYWIKNGALPIESVAQIFKSAGTQARFDRLKNGEAVEALVAEAAEGEAKRAAPSKTTNDTECHFA